MQTACSHCGAQHTLNATNGTFVDGERVRAAELSHLSEFRIGSTVVLVTITPKTLR